MITEREREVLQYKAMGYLDKEIADILNISLYTEKDHVVNVLDKLEAVNSTHAVAIALRNGYIH